MKFACRAPSTSGMSATFRSCCGSSFRWRTAAHSRASSRPPPWRSTPCSPRPLPRTSVNEGNRRGCEARARPTAARSAIGPGATLGLAFVDLLELDFRPLDAVRWGGPLDGLGVHVRDDVLGQRLGGVRGGRTCPANHPRAARGGPERLQRVVDLVPHGAVLPCGGGAHAVAVLDFEPLAELVLGVEP